METVEIASKGLFILNDYLIVSFMEYQSWSFLNQTFEIFSSLLFLLVQWIGILLFLFAFEPKLDYKECTCYDNNWMKEISRNV